MRINRLIAKNVQEYLNFDITFNENLTFLIGRNGSGKTSALKILIGLLTPSVNYLTQVGFENAELHCSSKKNENDIVIKASKNKAEGTLMLSLITKKEETTDIFDMKIFKTVEAEIPIDERSDKMRFLIEQFEVLKVVLKIKELPTPSFLGLERRIFEPRRHDYFYEREYYRVRKTRNSSLNDSINNSLDEMQNLIYGYIRGIPVEQTKHAEDFKNKILNTSFDFVDNIDAIDWENKKEIENRIKEINQKKVDLEKSIAGLNIGNIKALITKYFDNLEDTLVKYMETYKTSKRGIIGGNFEYINKYYINSPQLSRINEILKYSKEYQDKLTKINEPIRRLEKLATDFFQEADKQIHIRPNGEITIALPNKMVTSIYELSSGEKQILVMLTHLIFYEEVQNRTGIFIIDEPEISLHIAWQSIFVDSIRTASPKTQFILATHSPAIISELNNTKYCQDLSNS